MYENLDLFAYNESQRNLLKLLGKSGKVKSKKAQKVILMAAPSFVVDFDYKNFVPLMKGLGFDLVTELTFGAKMVNLNYHEYIKTHKNKQHKFISSVCPSSVALVKSQHPDLARFLMPFDSPMIAMAKIMKKHHPKHKIVFLAPCSAKRIEAKKYIYKKKPLIDCTVTFTEMKQIVAKEKPKSKKGVGNKFDSFYNDYTKVYPLSGGLSATLHSKDILKKNEIVACDGCNNLAELFSKHPDKTFYDILYCDGGCIGGNGVASRLPTYLKKRKVIVYRNLAKREKAGKTHIGVEKFTKGLNFSRNFD